MTSAADERRPPAPPRPPAARGLERRHRAGRPRRSRDRAVGRRGSLARGDRGRPARPAGRCVWAVSSSGGTGSVRAGPVPGRPRLRRAVVRDVRLRPGAGRRGARPDRARPARRPARRRRARPPPGRAASTDIRTLDVERHAGPGPQRAGRARGGSSTSSRSARTSRLSGTRSTRSSPSSPSAGSSRSWRRSPPAAQRAPGARADPRCAPPPARVRGRREPRAADAAGRRPGERRAPPAQPGQAGRSRSARRSTTSPPRVDHLTALVEDLLLLARSDSGAVELAREPVDLADVAADATGALSGWPPSRR